MALLASDWPRRVVVDVMDAGVWRADAEVRTEAAARKAASAEARRRGVRIDIVEVAAPPASGHFTVYARTRRSH